MAVQLRFVFVLAALTALTLQAAQASPPQTPSNHNATRADFDQLMKELSNWGRWGKDDQMGAVNLITPAKRKDALNSVKDGVSVSMARRAEIKQAVDNPRPITRVMNPRRGGGPVERRRHCQRRPSGAEERRVWSSDWSAAESNDAAAASVPVLVRARACAYAVDASTRSTDWVSNCYTARP
jgi:hypothetical protein